MQVLADRGQWFIELAPPGADEIFDTAVWACSLTSAEVNLVLQPLDVQVEWLKEEYLAEEPHREIGIDRLRAARRQRAYGRMGLQP